MQQIPYGFPLLGGHFNDGIKIENGVVPGIKSPKSTDQNHLNTVKNRGYLRPIKRPNYCQTKKRGKDSLNFGEKNMCLELEAGHENGQSEKYSESNSREASLRENLDPATEAGTRSENDAPDENKTRKRRVSKRNRRNVCKPNEDEADSKNKEESSSPETKTCELCSERFNNSHALTLHLKEHNSNSNRNNGSAHKCTLCHKILSSKSSLDRHALVHSGYKPHKCGICGVLFTTNGNMNRHIRIHENESKRKFEISEEKKHACTEECHHGFTDLFSFEFSSNKYPKIAMMSCEKERRCAPPSTKKAKYDYADQEAMGTLRVYSCNCCDHCFPCLRTLTEHQSKCSRCEICDRQFSHIQQFEHHMSIHNSEPEESLPPTEDGIKKENDWADVGKNEENYDDEGNGNSENQSTDKAEFFKAIGLLPLNQIKDVKVKEEDCALMDSEDLPSGYISEESTSCGELVIDESASSNVVPSNENEHSTLPPSESPLSTPDKADLSNNASISFSPLNDSPQKHTSSDEGLAKSLSPSDDSENSRSHTDTELPKGKFQCKKCFANFDDSKSFKSHSKTHFQHKNYKCESCTYTSVDKSTLLRHMRTHNGDRPFKCDICDYPFTTKTNAQRHIRKKHRIPRHECKKYAVYNHDRSETKLPGNIAENSTETVCKYCKCDFGNSRLLKHHLRSLRDSCSRKPYTCKKCHSGFSTKNNCIRHINKTHPECKGQVNELLVSNKLVNDETFGHCLNGGEKVKEAEFLDSNMNGENSNIMTDHDENQLLIEEDSHVQNQSEDYQDINHEGINSVVLNLKKDGGCLLENPPEYPRPFCELLNASDLKSAVDGLMSLSKSAPFQAEPLDLSLRPIDLSAKILPSINSVTPNYAKIFPRPLSSHREPLGDPLPVRLSIPKPYNPSFSTPSSLRGFNCEISRSSLSSAPEEQSLNCQANISASVSNEHKALPLDLSATNEGLSHNSFVSELRIAKDSSVPEKKNIPCNYCHKTFTLKSNKERHIKNHHPERARPPRSRNFIPAFSGAPVPKQIPNVSEVTRDKLRSVLIPKVYSSSPIPNEASMSLDGEVLSLVTEKKEKPFEYSVTNDTIPESFLRHGAKNDFENNDLASVSSVINTANSKEINRFLKDASLTDSQAQAEERMDASEVSNMSIDGHFGGKDKQFKCEFCGRAFNYASARERHMATHTGEKPYFCSKCNARFSTKSNRDRHEKKSCCEKTNYKNKSLSNPPKEGSKSPENQVSLKLDFSDLSSSIGTDRLMTDNRQHSIPFASSYRSDKIVNNSSVGSLELSNSCFSVHTLSSRYQSLVVKDNLECKICNNTYKNIEDLTNHMRELHPLEYKSLMGEAFDPEDTIRSWRKSMSGKRKTTS